MPKRSIFISMKEICALFTLFLFYSSSLVAQINEAIFNHYTVNNGISQSSVSCILQDKEGYIWFGTQNGLNKFNGYSFERFYPNPYDSTCITHGWIYALAEDDEGNIWVGTRSGLNKFEKKKGTFKRFLATSDKNSIFSNLVYGVACQDGNVFINTPPVLNILHLRTNQIHQYKNNIDIEKKAGSSEIGSPVLIDKKKNVWIASGKGLSKFNQLTKKFKNYFHSATDTSTIPDNFIYSVYEDKQGEIWIGTANGFCRYDEAGDKFIRFENKFRNNSILSIVQDNNWNFWLGTFGGGLNLVSFNQKKTGINYLKNYSNNINNDKTIISDVVSSLFQDKSQIMWIGSFLGMNTLDMKPKKFKLYKKTESEHSINLLDNFIASVYKDKNGILWVGNWGKGLNLLNRRTGHVTQYAPTFKGKRNIINGYVHVIFKDPDENMWIATRNGIQVLNPADSSFVDLNTFFKIKDLPEFRNTRIRKLYKDSKKNIWIGSNKGLYKIEYATRKVYEYLNQPDSNSISDNLIYDIIERKDGKFWIGTVNGLNLYDPLTSTFTRYRNDPKNSKSISSNMCINLLIDRDENLWIGTNCGFNVLKKGSGEFIHYLKKDGLPDEYIYNMIEDKTGKIWFSTNGGIGMIDETKKNNKIVSYTSENGLQGLEFSGGAYFKSETGEIFFGGVSGLNSFNPSIIPVNNYIPPVVITSFEKSNDKGKEKKIVHNGDVVELSYDDYEIVIEFAALDYTNPKANQYAYQMKGVSKGWVNTGNRNFVSFSKLPPDTYVFRVIGSNNDKIWNRKGVTLTIIIHPPFWRTWWFISLCVLSLIGIIILLFKLREKSLISEKTRLEQKVKERTEEVVYQSKQIERQKNELIKKNIKITDSIDYAKQIQDAFLPTQEQIKQAFPESFILFKPKDIVSGDFYWLNTKTERLMFAIADCTGHGVPGAFMSLISINLLNEIMDKKASIAPADMLDMLRLQLIASFKGEEKRQDGLDIALCSYHPVTGELVYAGAKNSMYFFRNNTLTEIKADKHSVAKFYNQENRKFTEHSFMIEKGDVIYLFSDGFADQKGGPLNKKYYYLPFRKLCLRVQGLSMEEQKRELEKEIDLWKGSNEQSDDILIMGIRF